MKNEIVKILRVISEKSGYSYETILQVYNRVTNEFPNMGFNEKIKLLLSLLELNKFIFIGDNKKVYINGYQLNIILYIALSDILIKKHNEKNKKTEEILDEYLEEHKYYLILNLEIKDALKKELGLREDVIRSCFNYLKREHKALNYKEIIEVMKFLLEFKGKFRIAYRRLIQIKDDFYNSSTISFIDTIINLIINNKETNPDEIINIYTNSYKKVFIDESNLKKEIVEKTDITILENKISETLGYSKSFFKQLFRMLKCRNSSVTDDSYINCLNMVIDLSAYVDYDESKRHKIVIERLNYKYNASTFWLMLFELKLKNPSMTLEDAVLKVVEQTSDNPSFCDKEKSSNDKVFL